MPISIMLDAGHGGRDVGASYMGRQEKDDTLNLVFAIGEILQNNGIDVEYTRTTDVYESPYQKALEANEVDADYFVSIHRNSSEEANQYMGVQSLVYDLSGIKYEMAQNINQQLETVGFVNLGVAARPNLVVLKRTDMPAVLVEVGFINSDTDNEIFDQNFTDIAQAIAQGILETIRTESLHEDDIYYSVQVGLFRNNRYADRMQQTMENEGFPAFIDEYGEFRRVRVGMYERLADAIEMEKSLKRAGYQTVIISEDD